MPKRVLRVIILYTLLCLGAVVFLIPLIWMVSDSLKSYSEIVTIPPTWIPSLPRWSNYAAWNDYSFNTFLRNSCVVTGLTLLGDLVTSSLVAFGFARLRSRTSNLLFIVLLATMMIPYQVIIIPQFILFKFLGWINTLKPLFITSYFAWPFFVFLFRQFFMTIPRELDESAKIDGCSSWRIYWNIIIPLSKPAFGVVAIFSFVGNWNNFMAPLIYLSSTEKYTLQLGLSLLNVRMGGVPYNSLMAISVLILLPIIVVFLINQKYIFQGIDLTGVKK